MIWGDLEVEQCGVARFLSVFGDRWSMLILTDAMLGVRRFETFQERLGISRTILTQRLADLVEHGVFERVAYQQSPERFEYRMTRKALDAYPAVMFMAHWGNQHLSDEGGRPIHYEHTTCGHDFEPRLDCSECGEPAHPWEVRAYARADVPGLAPVRRRPIVEGEESARESR